MATDGRINASARYGSVVYKLAGCFALDAANPLWQANFGTSDTTISTAVDQPDLSIGQKIAQQRRIKPHGGAPQSDTVSPMDGGLGLLHSSTDCLR